MIVVRLQLSKMAYYISLTHGAGGGTTKGASANKLDKFSQIVSGCDCYVLGHFHDQINYVDMSYYPDRNHGRISEMKYLCVHAGSTLGYENGYAEGMMLKPKPKGLAILKAFNVSNYGKDNQKKVMQVRYEL